MCGMPYSVRRISAVSSVPGSVAACRSDTTSELAAPAAPDPMAGATRIVRTRPAAAVRLLVASLRDDRRAAPRPVPNISHAPPLARPAPPPTGDRTPPIPALAGHPYVPPTRVIR